MTVIFLGKTISGRFAIPSGILTTRTGLIEKVAEMIPEVGVITTKSVGVYPEPGYREPILCEESPLNFINAVGLRSPGMEVMEHELLEMRNRHERDALFHDKFILISVYGKTEDEFRQVIDHLSGVADGFELNLSCPHSKPGYGASIGSHPETAFSFTKAAVSAAREHDIPVLVKLTPNVPDIGMIAESVINAGAQGITAINTVGPITYRDPVSGKPILTHGTGGKSGRWIRDVGAQAIREIRQRVGPTIPIIGMGGISSVQDIEAYRDADIFGIGSVLAGLDIDAIAAFFRHLSQDMITGTGSTGDILSIEPHMKYQEFRIREIQELDHDLKVFILDGELQFLPAQFVFLWIPGSGEKPFSPALQDPLTLAIRKRGILTSKFFKLQEGDTFMVRGPYGRGFIPDGWDHIHILAGGTGSGVALRLAQQAFSLGKEVTVFQGSTNESQVLFEKEFRRISRFIPGIDMDEPGEIIKVMKYHLEHKGIPENSVFFNIGPEIMMKSAMELESTYLDPVNIFASMERETLCGVGLCGACELNGYRTCIRGTVFPKSFLDTMEGGVW